MPIQEYYIHTPCGTKQRMGMNKILDIQNNPGKITHAFCRGCLNYFPIGHDGEFVWADEEPSRKVGT